MLISAGVGIPSGVTGTPLMHLHEPSKSSSTSAAGAQSVNSGYFAAADNPGILAVSVLPISERYCITMASWEEC